MPEIRCHYVPRFYLNYFLATGSKCFWVYDKKELTEKPQAPKDTAAIWDYYLSEPDAQGQTDKRMEVWLSQIEDEAKKIFDAWQDTKIISKEQMPTVAVFLALAHCRVPRSVDLVKQVMCAGLEKVFDKWEATAADPGKLKAKYEFYKEKMGDKFQLSFQEFSEFLSDPQKHFYFDVNEKHAIGESFLLLEEITKVLFELSWGLREAEGENFFLTSDAPVGIFTPVAPGKVIFGAGFKRESVEIYFPISPKLCLYLRRTPLREYSVVGAKFVNEINNRIAHMAERYVISPFKSNRIKKMVLEAAPKTFNKPKINAPIIKERLRSLDGVFDTI